MQDVLQYLKKHGQLLDAEIAAGMGLPLKKIKEHLATLATLGEISTCRVTRFNGPDRFEGTLCRPAGFSPPRSPGRTAGAPAKEVA